MMNIEQKKNLIVFSLQHFYTDKSPTAQMLSRLSQHRHIIYFQAPIFGVAQEPTYLLQKSDEHITVVQPYIPVDISVFDQKDVINEIIHEVLEEEQVDSYSIWTDTPKAMPFIRELHPEVLVYDGREANNYSNPELEEEITKKADLILKPQKLLMH